jgi:hypothetical protein
MKVTITFDDGSTFTAESFSFELAAQEVAEKAGLLEEGDAVRVLCKESQQILG